MTAARSAPRRSHFCGPRWASGRGCTKVRSRRVARGRTPFTRRFASSAQEIVLRAQELCRQLGSAEVTPAHVLLAMLEDDVLRPTLERRGITEEAVRAVLPSGPPRTGAGAHLRRGEADARAGAPAVARVVGRARVPVNPCVLRAHWRGGSFGSSRSPRDTAQGSARLPSASGTSTATRTWRRSGSTAGSTWRSSRRPRCRSWCS